MKLTSMKTCMCLFRTLACLLLMGICPEGTLCSSPDNHINMGHAIHDECCNFTHVSSEDHFCFEHATTEHSAHECCQRCSDSPFHFGCGGGLILTNHTRSITFTTFTWISVVTNDTVLAKEKLSPQSLGIANSAIPFLRTIILLT
jgi:hypothetical protein